MPTSTTPDSLEKTPPLSQLAFSNSALSCDIMLEELSTQICNDARKRDDKGNAGLAVFLTALSTQYAQNGDGFFTRMCAPQKMKALEKLVYLSKKSNTDGPHSLAETTQTIVIPAEPISTALPSGNGGYRFTFGKNQTVAQALAETHKELAFCEAEQAVAHVGDWALAGVFACAAGIGLWRVVRDSHLADLFRANARPHASSARIYPEGYASYGCE